MKKEVLGSDFDDSEEETDKPKVSEKDSERTPSSAQTRELRLRKAPTKSESGSGSDVIERVEPSAKQAQKSGQGGVVIENPGEDDEIWNDIFPSGEDTAEEDEAKPESPEKESESQPGPVFEKSKPSTLRKAPVMPDSDSDSEEYIRRSLSTARRRAVVLPDSDSDDESSSPKPTSSPFKRGRIQERRTVTKPGNNRKGTRRGSTKNSRSVKGQRKKRTNSAEYSSDEYSVHGDQSEESSDTTETTNRGKIRIKADNNRRPKTEKSGPRKRKRKDKTDKGYESEEPPSKIRGTAECGIKRAQACLRLRSIPKKQMPDYAKIENESIDFLERMVEARNADLEAYNAKKPPMAKYKMLREVEDFGVKKHHQPFLLQNNFLAIIKMWLEPYSDGVMPNVQVRTGLLNILQLIPVDNQLKEYVLGSDGIGFTVHFLSKKDEHASNKSIATQILQSWYRQFTADGDDFDVFSGSFGSEARQEAREAIREQEKRTERAESHGIGKRKVAVAPQGSLQVYDEAPPDAAPREVRYQAVAKAENKKEALRKRYKKQKDGSGLASGIDRMRKSSQRFHRERSPFGGNGGSKAKY